MGVVAGMEVGGREGMADLLCEMCPRCKVLFCDNTGFGVSHLVEKCLQLRSKGC
jgi:hypothetical protein